MFDFFGELKKLEKLKTNVLVDHVACIAIVLYCFTTFLLNFFFVVKETGDKEIRQMLWSTLLLG